MESIIDIPAIQKAISEKHEQFMEKAGSLPEKLEADRQLQIAKVESHVGIITKSLIDEGIIDSCADVSIGTPYLQIVLYKARHENHVHIASDGWTVIVYEQNFLHQVGMARPEYKVFRDVHSKDFDWKQFAIDVLDLIHLSIYERKRVMEFFMDDIFSNNIVEDERPFKKIVLKKPTADGDNILTAQIGDRVIRVTRPSKTTEEKTD